MALHPAVTDAVKGKTILWGAPTIDQTRIGWEEAKRACGEVFEFRASERIAKAPGNGQIVFRTLDDPGNARGFTYDGAVLDEASLIKPEAWYEVIRATLSDTGGWSLAIFTPKGRNWVWAESEKARDRSDYAAWQIPTLGVEVVGDGLVRKPHPLENPFFPFSEAVSLFQSVPLRVFQQEFLAQFLEDAGGVFRNVRACATATRDEPQAHAGHNVVFGVDWGQQNDYTVIAALCADCRRQVDLDRFNQVAWALQRGRLAAMRDKWQPYSIIAESNSIGSPLVEALQGDGLPVVAFETTAVSKPPLIQSLVLAFERSEIKILSDDWLISELESYEEKRSAVTGRPAYSAPEGLHDDGVMALALAWYGYANGRSQVETVPNREYSISAW